MPLYETKHIDTEVILAVWRIEEEEQELYRQVYLSEEDKLLYERMRSEKRRKEWLATRLLVQLMLEEDISISYEDSGKPYIANATWRISISHKKEFVGVILAQNNEVAIDIEELSGRIDTIYDYYMRTDELEQIVRNHRNYQLHLYWCAKECLIKITGNRTLSILNDMYVHPIHPVMNSFFADVQINEETATYEMFYEKLSNDYVVVWTLRND